MNQLHLIPRHPDAPISEGMARRVARRGRRRGLQTAGVNAPGRMNMKGLLQRYKWAAISAASVERIRPEFAPEEPAQFNFCVLLVSFADHAITHPLPEFEKLLNGVDVAKQSVREYYRGQSGDMLDIVAEVVPVTLARNYGDYVGGNYGFGAYPNNAQGMVVDAVNVLSAAGFDFSKYDNDGDGIIDGLGVIHPGSGAELTGNPNHMWSHKWGVPPTIVAGGTVSEYYTAPEYWYETIKMTIGVHVHEIGHVFGLADHYDTDGSSRGEGNSCVMASGSWLGQLGDRPCSFCAQSRYHLGFVRPNLYIGGIAPMRLVPGAPYMLPASPGNRRQYYLVEYRPTTGQDSAMPFGGIKIDRVNLDMPGNQWEWYPGKDPSRMPRVAMIQADNLYELEHKIGNLDQGDFYRVPNSFRPNSSPSSDWPDGSATDVEVRVTSITEKFADVEMGYIRVVGDVTGDGVVNVADFKALVRGLFMGGPVTPGMDLDGDGQPTALDLGVLIDKLIGEGLATEAELIQAMQELTGG